MQALPAWRAAAALVAALLTGCAATPPLPPAQQLNDEVRAAETAFARTMADRNFSAFAGWLADDAVFINGGKPLRGKAEVLAFWKRFFEQPTAPFAWRPEVVEVTTRGDLGYTEGPVWVGASPTPTSRFYTTWRRMPDGAWRVVFDNGYPLCNCPK